MDDVFGEYSETTDMCITPGELTLQIENQPDRNRE